MTAWSRAERMDFLHLEHDADIESEWVPADRQSPHSANFKPRVVLSCGHFAYEEDVYGVELDSLGLGEALCGPCMVERSVIKP